MHSGGQRRPHVFARRKGSVVRKRVVQSGRGWKLWTRRDDAGASRVESSVPTRRRPKSVVAAVVTGGLLVAGVGIFPGASPASAAVPAPSSTTSVITVKVGGDRSGQGITDLGQTIATPLAGVRLGLFATSTSASPVNTTWAQCTSDAAGDCSFVVPNTQVGGANRDVRYWVKQISAPTGWYMNPTLRTGSASFPPHNAQTYQFLTGVELRANTTYSSLSDFMYRPADSANVPNLTSSSGVWQQSRENPVLPRRCGLDIALILDLSSSMTLTPGEPFTTANAVSDAFVGTPTRMAVFTYGQWSPATNGGNRPTLLPVSTQAGADAFKAQWANWGVFGGTNWDSGFYETAAAAPHYDFAIHITDGNPSLYGNPLPAGAQSSHNRLKETEYGIFSANLLKSEGTRILAVGAGNGVSGSSSLNLRATSGPIAYNGSNMASADYIQATDFTAAVAALRDYVRVNCAGSISVVKQIVPSGNVGEDVTGATPAPAGWEFAATTPATGIGGLPSTKSTVGDGTGAVNFPLTFTGTTSGAVTVKETQQSGYEIVTQGGKNATCVDTLTGAPVAVTNDNSTVSTPGFTLTASAPQAISCVIYNKQKLESDLTVQKSWVVDGQTYADGDQPAGLAAQLQLTGPGAAGATDQAWGTTRSGYVRGDTATITEDTTLSDDYEHCDVSAKVTEVNGATTNTALDDSGFAMTLSAEHNTARITNTVTCTQNLTLVKVVDFGDEPTSSWTLTATAPAGALPGPSGSHSASTPVTAPVTAAVGYSLSESGGPDTYLQAGQWACALTDDPSIDVNVQDGFLVVPRGQDVTCTVHNATARITLLKHVIDPSDGFEADAWDLTATPDPLAGGSLPTETVVGAEAETNGGSSFDVRPNHTYTLSEVTNSTLLAYRQLRLEKLDGTNWVTVDDAEIQAPDPGETATYRFVNERLEPITLPLTGGSSADSFLIAGGVVLLLALAGALIGARRRRSMT